MSQVPMSQARKSFGAEMAKLQMAGAQGGKDDEAKFLRGVSTLGKDLSCCLCLSTFERPVRTSCKHYYCAECLNESLRRKQQCPLCKTKVTRRDVEDDEFVAALRSILGTSLQPFHGMSEVAQLEALFAALDTNRDGVVDYDELSTFLRSRSGSEGVA